MNNMARMGSLAAIMAVMLIGMASAGSVAVTITNNQASPTASPFQQMLYFNPSGGIFAGNVSSDLGNMRFYAGGTELNSWCESGCSSGASNSVFWVKLPSGIPAGQNVIINITFVASEYDGVFAGEAPNMTGSYGQYDNGFGIFRLYDNFYGDTVNSSTWNSVCNEGGNTGTPSISNGLSITGGSCLITSSAFDPHSETIDFRGYYTFGNADTFWQTDSISGESGIQFNVWGNGGASSATGYCTIGTCFGGGSTSSYNIWSMAVDSSNIYVSLAYSNAQTLAHTVSAPDYIGIGNYWNGATASNYNWIRLRDTPPDGVMPSFNYTAGGSLALSVQNPTPATNTILQSQSSNMISAGASGGTSPYTYQWLGGFAANALTAAYANSVCAPNGQQTFCQFDTTGSTAVGSYNFELEAFDSTGNSVVSNEVNVIVNKPLPLTIPTPTPSTQSVWKGDSISVTDAGAANGVTPYAYQWLTSFGSGSFTATMANQICASPQSLTCSFATNSLTIIGTYKFKLQVADNLGNTISSGAVNALVTNAIGIRPYLAYVYGSSDTNSHIYGYLAMYVGNVLRGVVTDGGITDAYGADAEAAFYPNEVLSYEHSGTSLSGNLTIRNHNLPDGGVVINYSTSQLFGIAIAPDGTGYVTNWRGNNIIVFSNNAVTGSGGACGAYGLAASQTNPYLYTGQVGLCGSIDSQILDRSNFAVINSIVGSDTVPYIAISPNGKYLYLSDLNGGYVHVIATSNNVQVATISGTISGNCGSSELQGISISPDGSYGYVACHQEITVFSTSNNMAVAELSDPYAGVGISGIAFSNATNVYYNLQLQQHNAVQGGDITFGAAIYNGTSYSGAPYLITYNITASNQTVIYAGNALVTMNNAYQTIDVPIANIIAAYGKAPPNGNYIIEANSVSNYMVTNATTSNFMVQGATPLFAVFNDSINTVNVINGNTINTDQPIWSVTYSIFTSGNQLSATLWRYVYRNGNYVFLDAYSTNSINTTTYFPAPYLYKLVFNTTGNSNYAANSILFYVNESLTPPPTTTIPPTTVASTSIPVGGIGSGGQTSIPTTTTIAENSTPPIITRVSGATFNPLANVTTNITVTHPFGIIGNGFAQNAILDGYGANITLANQNGGQLNLPIWILIAIIVGAYAGYLYYKHKKAYIYPAVLDVIIVAGFLILPLAA